MKSNAIRKSKKARKIWVPILLIILAAAGVAGYWIWSQQNVATTEAAGTTLNTSTVKQGSITISVSGSGSLIAGQEKDLAFSTAGTVASVNVQVGDVVKQGQALAELGDLDELKDAVNAAQQDLIVAQKDLQTLKEDAAANLANAQLALATAQKAVIEAKSGLIQKGQVRCDQETMDAYYYKYTQAKKNLDALTNQSYDHDYYLKTIVPAKNAVASAFSTYEYCTGFTDYEISSSQATLSLDEAKLVQAQQTLDTLTANNGIDPIELAQAQNKVDNAQLALDQANENLAGTKITAPFDGTILSVAGSAGDSVGTSAFITIADLAHPQVQYSIDETDMENVSIGENATVTFDAYPGVTFPGKVTRINPSLQSSGGYQVVTGLIQLDLSQVQNPPTLIKGLNGSVELIQASAKDVLIIPVQAVRDLGNGQYGVFVVGSDGQTKLKFVEVGIMDAASAEIKSGLTLGETVSTGEAQTK